MWNGLKTNRCIYKKVQYLAFTVKATQNFAQHSLRHVIYTTAKFEVATSISLRGEAFTIGMKFYFLFFIDV